MALELSQVQAYTRLRSMTAADAAPALTEGEMADLLELCKVTDADGLDPDDTGWEPTWELPVGAAEGWRWKAAKVAGDFAFSAEGASFHREQAVQQCLTMVDRYVAQCPAAGVSRYGHGEPPVEVLGN